jgi:hypothetical protein
MAQEAFNKKKIFHQKIGPKFEEETSRVPHLECSIVKVLKPGHFGK